MRSIPSRPASRAARASACCAVLIGLAGHSSGAERGHEGPLPQDRRIEGEFGLYVGVLEKGLEVRWLTRDSAPGVVRVWVGEELAAEKETAGGTAHRAVLPVVEPRVTLEYGLDRPGRLHRTDIWREPELATEVVLDAKDSVYLFGDVHGQFDRIVTLLRGADLVDAELAWTGGERTVVFLGDIFDRGPDVTRVLWLLYRLEHEAAEAGGRVQVVLGNHELMVMSGDLRYVAAKEALLGFEHRLRYQDLFDPAESLLGRWLASKPGLLRMEDLLLAHGGVSPGYVEYGLQEFQDTLRAFIAESLFVGWNDTEFLERFRRTTSLDSAAVGRRWGFFFGPESVFWYRDLVLSDTLDAFLDTALDRFEAEVHIVAHTPVETIHERYEGRLIAVDLLDAASEMLLMTRTADGSWLPFKIPLEGEPIPLDGGTWDR